MKWILTGCDINKDVTVSDKVQLTAIDIQLKDAGRVFRLYIKSLGDKAVYRVEESVKMWCPIVDILRTIRSPSIVEQKIKRITPKHNQTDIGRFIIRTTI